MKPIRRIRSHTVVLDRENIDTDQIIPARFLTTTGRGGLGAHLFHAWRYAADGNERPEFPLNQPANRTAQVLVAGRNFGCGSSREHAPWALLDFGVRAVISSEIADIFRSNALKNGLLAIEVPDTVHRWLLEHPGDAVEIDLEDRALRFGAGGEYTFKIDEFARDCLLRGMDELDYLLSHATAVTRFEQRQMQ